jgi:hypothetical protein
MTRAVARTKVPRTKVPALTFDCSDFEIEVGGEVYHPHAGETVTMAATSAMGDLTTMLELDKLEIGSGMSAEETKEAVAIIARMTSHLEKSIIAWTWTNDAKPPELYSSPPSREDLTSLSMEEQAYLIGRSFGRASEATRKNGSSPSTSPSRRVRRAARKSRRSG